MSSKDISQAYNLTTIAGTVNTPMGPITSKYDFDNGLMEVSAPEGTIGRIGIPKNGHMISKISHNDVVIYLHGANILITHHFLFVVVILTSLFLLL